MFIWFYLIIATLCIQIPNIWAINKFATEPTLKSAAVIGLFCLPASFIANTCYAYFYGMGNLKYDLNYPTMAVSAYAVSLIIAFIVQQVILKNKEILIADYFSLFFIIIGIIITIYRIDINSYFFK
jgi:hypothetical protein